MGRVLTKKEFTRMLQSELRRRKIKKGRQAYRQISLYEAELCDENRWQRGKFKIRRRKARYGEY